VEFSSARPVQIVGAVDAYANRPGFWQGSLNVAACWFGGALGLARSVLSGPKSNPGSEQWAAAAELADCISTMELALAAAGDETDADPLDSSGRAKERAFALRHRVYMETNRVLRLAAEMGGTRGITQDYRQSLRFTDLPVYLRQHHPKRDLESLGQMILKRYQDG
jgi:hypothetical protein